jgi:hypothetical protein
MSDTFFGVQLALELPPGHALRDQLAQVVRSLRDSTAIPMQRPAWTQASRLLREAVPFARMGTWDLIRDNAQGEYEDWASGLEAMAEWPAEDFGSDGLYVLACVIMLVAGGSNADRTLGDICDLPENTWHLHRTYDQLLAAPPQLNFTNVLGSGLYLAPRPDQPGFAHEVLKGEGFEYLENVRE